MVYGGTAWKKQTSRKGVIGVEVRGKALVDNGDFGYDRPIRNALSS